MPSERKYILHLQLEILFQTKCVFVIVRAKYWDNRNDIGVMYILMKKIDANQYITRPVWIKRTIVEEKAPFSCHGKNSFKTHRDGKS